MKTRWRSTVGAAAMAGLALSASSCQDVYLTAPPGSTIDLVANPRFVSSHGGPAGSSELTAFVIEAAGTPVADGTVVFWTTDLGRVDRETRTRNGFTRARFESDSRSGTATVRAFSGGGSSGGGPTTTTTTVRASGPVFATSQAPERPLAGAWSATSPGGLVAAGSAIASLAAARQAEATTTIEVGNVRVAFVHLRANPPRIPSNSNSTHVIALVVDTAGNPVANVPVFFEVVTNPSTEFFDITGPVHTNNNGEAENVLRTRRTTTGVATVQARAIGGADGSVTSEVLVIPIL